MPQQARLVLYMYLCLHVMVEKLKIQTKHTPTIAEPLIGDALPNENDTVKASGHTVDPTDVHMYEFLIQDTPNPLT